MKTTRSHWADTVLICAKCSKKLDGGFGPKGRTSLAKALRRDLGIGKGRKATLGIVEVKCLKVCPKGAVTVVNGRSPETWVLVPPGAASEDVAQQLNLGPALPDVGDEARVSESHTKVTPSALPSGASGDPGQATVR